MEQVKEQKQADTEAVVRCQNCAHSPRKSNLAYCGYFGRYMPLDGFCCFGIRRIEEDGEI